MNTDKVTKTSFIVLTQGGYMVLNKDSHYHDQDNENPYGWLTSTTEAFRATRLSGEEVHKALDKIGEKYKKGVKVQIFNYITTTTTKIDITYNVEETDI